MILLDHYAKGSHKWLDMLENLMKVQQFNLEQKINNFLGIIIKYGKMLKN